MGRTMAGPLTLFCSVDNEILVPAPGSNSGWGDQIRGMATCAALARGAERTFSALERPNLKPTRWTVDLLAPVRHSPLRIETSVVREGRRLVLIDARLIQEGRLRARASALFLGGDPGPVASTWSSEVMYEPPPISMQPLANESRWYYSDPIGWAPGTAVHQHSNPKRSWHREVIAVEGEITTPFQFAAGIADVANVVANWGEAGLEYINADVTMSLIRLPDELEVGLAAVDRFAYRGTSVATAHMFDRRGVFAVVGVNSLKSPTPTDPGFLDKQVIS